MGPRDLYFVIEWLRAMRQYRQTHALFGLHTARINELISRQHWLEGKQILRLAFECHLLVPRLSYVNDLRLSASLKAWYGNEAVEEFQGCSTAPDPASR